MPYLVWSEDLDTKIPEIDTQHRTMIDHINQIQRLALQPDATPSTESLSQALQELIDCTREHFSYEEQLLEMIEFPSLDEHRASHHEVIAGLEAQRKQVLEEGADPQTLSEFLAQWLVTHIRHDDMDFGPMVREWMQDAAPPNDPFRKLIGEE